MAKSIHMTIFCQCNRELSSTGNFFYSNSTKNIHFLWGKVKGKPAIVLQGHKQIANMNLICNSCFQKRNFFILTVLCTHCRIILINAWKLIQGTERDVFFNEINTLFYVQWFKIPFFFWEWEGVAWEEVDGCANNLLPTFQKKKSLFSKINLRFSLFVLLLRYSHHGLHEILQSTRLSIRCHQNYLCPVTTAWNE